MFELLGHPKFKGGSQFVEVSVCSWLAPRQGGVGQGGGGLLMTWCPGSRDK